MFLCLCCCFFELRSSHLLPSHSSLSLSSPPSPSFPLSLCVSLPPLPPSSLLFRFLTQFCCRVWLCCNCIKDKLPNRHSCLKPLCLCNKSSVSQSPLFFFLFFFSSSSSIFICGWDFKTIAKQTGRNVEIK